MTHSDLAALRGEPGYVWRSGQERRLNFVKEWVDLSGDIFDDGCGLGTWMDAFERAGGRSFGLEVEFDRAKKALNFGHGVVIAEGESLPFASSRFDVVFSNEVIEHVANDRRYMQEMVRVVKPGGRIFVYCPNRWYPVEQHGIYWRGEYHFGNKPLVNYLPDPIRDRLAPHVRTYTKRKLQELYRNLPVEEVYHTRIFGGYDNIITRRPRLGAAIRQVLYAAEQGPLAILGISHLLVLQKREVV
ncbi:MAG: methyltransferase domain-containing protein [Chloroflexota bacterium]